MTFLFLALAISGLAANLIQSFPDFFKEIYLQNKCANSVKELSRLHNIEPTN